MLSARKNTLEKTTAMNLVNLQQTELQFYVNNFNSLALMATIVAGTSFEMMDLIETGGQETLFWACCCSAISLNTICATASVFVNIHGSGLALHGKQGSLSRSVALMNTWQNLLVALFSLGARSPTPLRPPRCPPPYLVLSSEYAPRQRVFFGTARSHGTNVVRARRTPRSGRLPPPPLRRSTPVRLSAPAS